MNLVEYRLGKVIASEQLRWPNVHIRYEDLYNNIHVHGLIHVLRFQLHEDVSKKRRRYYENHKRKLAALRKDQPR